MNQSAPGPQAHHSRGALAIFTFQASGCLRWLGLILGLYLLLALGYGIATPLFEAPDEHHHYFTIQQIVETGKLPVAAESGSLARQEAAQPPLYYLLAALLILPLDTAGAETYLWPNRYVRLGDAHSPDNLNAFVHTAVEAWPWQGYALAVHLLRGMSAFLGVGTLVCIYASGRLLWPEAPERGLLATAMVAFLPQFGFLHGAVSNDPLIILLSAAALWQLLQLWLGGLSRGKIVALGVTIGLAILAKMTGLLLLFFASGVLFLLTWRSSHWRHLMKTMALLILPVLLIAGWLLWRNWMLYGDVTAVNQFIELAGGDRGYGWRQILGDMDRVWLSFFAFFGWMNVQPPAWVYLAWNGLVALAGVGAVVGLVKYRQSLSFSRASATSTLLFQPWTPGALLGAWFLFLLAAWVRFMMRTPADQGRLLFPALVPLALALAYGLSQYRQVWIYWGASLLALATSLYCLAVVIPAAYTPPLTITEAEVPPTAVPFDVDMGQGLELVAVQLETKASRPGEWVWLTLYWRAYAVPPRGPVAVLELLGRQLTLVGKRHIYYDGGLYPASLWPAGGVIADRLGIRLDEQMTVPTQVRLFLHVVEGTEPVEAGNLKVVPARWPARESSVLARLGNGIELVTADLATTTTHPGAGLTVHIRWQVTAAPAGDLTTFVHLGEPTQPPLAQADGPPVNGDYPTRFWAAGEVITDSYTLVMPPDLPDGRYPVYLGLYDPNTGIRLPLVSRGVRQINDAYLAGWLTVEP